MSSILNNAAGIKPPVLNRDIIVLDSATTHDAVEIPSTWLAHWVTIQADGCDVVFGFSTDPTAEVSTTGKSTLTGAAVSAVGATSGMKIDDGQERHFDLSLLATLESGGKWHFVHEESAASAYVRLIRSSGPSKRD